MNGPDKIGRYRLEDELDLVGLGQFWRGSDVLTEETVLIQGIPFGKLCDPNHRSDLFRRLIEAHRQVIDLTHPQIRRILGVSRTAEVLFVCHQWRLGQSLGSLIAADPKPFNAERVAAVLGEIARALEWAHERRAVYGRLSPLAVGLDEEGAFLVDYGLAPLLLQATERRGGTLSQPEYLAPEQVSGKRADAMTDGYALAVMAYRLLTGSFPFTAETQEELLDNIRYREPRPPEFAEPALNPNSSRVLLKALSKDPENRFGSPTLFTTSLGKTLIREEQPEAPAVARTVPQPAATRVPPSRSRRFVETVQSKARTLLGLAPEQSPGRQEKALLITSGVALTLLALSLLLYLVQPMSSVRDRIARGQIEEADELLKRLRSRWETDPDLHPLSAELQFRMGNYEAAVAEFWEARANDPEALRDASVEALLIKLFFVMPGDKRAFELARQALAWSGWPQNQVPLGLGSAPRAARFLHLLVLSGREREAADLASELAERLLHRPSHELAAALIPLVPVVRSSELNEALGVLLLRQGFLAQATEILRQALAVGDARQILTRRGAELMQALDLHPDNGELRAFLAENEAWVDEGLRLRLQAPSPLVRLGALRVFESAGVSIEVPLEQSLEWQLEEMRNFGTSPGLERRIAEIEARAPTTAPVLFLLAQYDLWRGDYSRCLDRLDELFQANPEAREDETVRGMLLVLLRWGRDPQRWLTIVGTERAPALLELAEVAPDARLRERAGELFRVLGLERSPTPRLLVDLRDVATSDRLAVAEELAGAPEPEARNALESLAIQTSDPWVRQRIEALLGARTDDKEPTQLPSPGR